MTTADPAREPENSARRSLFADIFDWMMVPLLIVWPLGVGVTYIISVTLADSAFDQALAVKLRTFTTNLAWFAERGEVSLGIQPAALFPDGDASFYRIQDTRAQVLSGDEQLPFLTPKNRTLKDPTIITAAYEDIRVRAAATWHLPPGAGAPLLVVLAESTDRRTALANEIMRDMMVPQGIIVVSLVLLMWFGMRRGTAPLEQLRERVAARQPNDLSRLDAPDAPIEVEPLIRAFNDLLSRVERAGFAQRRFIANAAHQLRTPLAGVKTQTELALRDTEPASQQAALRNIAAGTARTAHLVNQLLALARAEADAAVELNLVAVDLRVVAREAAEAALPRARAKDIDLGVELPETEVIVTGEPTLLHELAANLAENAIAYTPNGGHVTLRVAQRVPGNADDIAAVTPARSAMLEVEDNGIGIPEAERELVFERFHRVMGTGVQGSGLGLAIVREVAERHRATVQIATPVAGTGTLMRVTFPLAAPPTGLP